MATDPTWFTDERERIRAEAAERLAEVDAHEASWRETTGNPAPEPTPAPAAPPQAAPPPPPDPEAELRQRLADATSFEEVAAITADINAYTAPPHAPPELPEEQRVEVMRKIATASTREEAEAAMRDGGMVDDDGNPTFLTQYSRYSDG